MQLETGLLYHIMHQAFSILAEPFFMGRFKAELGFAQADFFGKRPAHDLAKDPFGPAFAEFEAGGAIHGELSELVIEHGNASLDGVSHGVAVLIAEQGRDAVMHEVGFLTLTDIARWANVLRRHRLGKMIEVIGGDAREKRGVGAVSEGRVAFCLAPAPGGEIRGAQPGDGFREEFWIGLGEELAEIERIKFAVAAESFVAALPVEKNGNGGLARSAHDGPLRVDAGTAGGLIVMPEHAFSLGPEAVGLGMNKLGVNSSVLGHGFDVAAFVKLWFIEDG